MKLRSFDGGGRAAHLARLTATAALVACDNPSGAGEGYARISDVRLDQVQVDIEARSNGDQILVDASLSFPGASIAVLDDETMAITTPNAGPFAFVGPGDYGGYHYFVLAQDAATSFDLVLTRDKEEMRGTIELPPAFTVTAETTAPRAFDISWSPMDAEARVGIRVTGPCISSIGRTLERDLGTYTLQPADFVLTSTTGCTAGVAVTRAPAKVALVTGLGGGSTAAVTQTRTVAIEVTP